MELQFHREQVNCLRQLKSEVQTQEQTQELKLPDNLPDIGRIMAAWGQAVVRGKEWRGNEMGISCNVTAWVLYAPEDGSAARCVECSLPISLRYSLTDADRDGSIICHCLLKSVDARTLSGRKMMVRATVSAMAQAYLPWQAEIYKPDNVPEDIALQEKVYPMCLLREAGEKAFVLDEELSMADGSPEVDEIIRYSLIPEVNDQKVLGDKAVFRGNGILHILYRTPEGAMASRDFEIPFSQYTELQQEYGHQAQVHLMPLVTGIELEMGEQGRIRLKAGMSGQYLITELCDIPVVTDGYSAERSVAIHTENIEIPAVLQWQEQMMPVDQTGNFAASRVADAALCPVWPRMQRDSDHMETEHSGSFQTLYYDTDGLLQAASTHYQLLSDMEIAPNVESVVWCSVAGKNTATPAGETTGLQGAVSQQMMAYTVENMPAVTCLTVGEAKEKDPARPSLILRRAGEDDLWTVAKSCGSTVKAIMEANGLTDEPEPNKILLIPVL